MIELARAFVKEYWEELLIAMLVILVYSFFTLWMHEKVSFAEFQSKSEQAGRDASDAEVLKDKEHKENLAEIRKDHEDKIPAIRADAVANYLAHRVVRQQPGSGEVRGTGPGIKLDDGAVSQCVPDEQFIQNAAEDATKIAAWQQYGKLNHIPVKD